MHDTRLRNNAAEAPLKSQRNRETLNLYLTASRFRGMSSSYRILNMDPVSATDIW